MKRMTLIVFLVVSDFKISYGMEQRFTPRSNDDSLVFIEDVNVAGFGDAQHRGRQWYDYESETDESGSDLKSSSEDESSPSVETSISSSKSSEASSVETDEKRRATKTYRTCTPCPHDMMKKYKNFGIKWICGGYQRARRSFKSECMMRYRNCQDGTMFVKLYDHRCKNSTDHGRHWFYVYKTSVDLRKHSIKDTGGWSRKKHEDPPEGMYEEVDDSGRSERVDVVLSLVPNVTRVDDIKNDLRGVETRRKGKGKKNRSTSSSEGMRPKDEKGSSEADKESLELSSHEITSESSDEKRKPKSTEERKGWRKWHRKCSPCPEDMAKKWRDPSIEWICGGYQRARRSFKSPCMMYYRNCQDGTMFVKIHDHKCADDADRGVHFFYDYKVKMEDESSDTADSKSSMTDESSA